MIFLFLELWQETANASQLLVALRWVFFGLRGLSFLNLLLSELIQSILVQNYLQMVGHMLQSVVRNVARGNYFIVGLHKVQHFKSVWSNLVQCAFAQAYLSRSPKWAAVEQLILRKQILVLLKHSAKTPKPVPEGLWLVWESPRQLDGLLRLLTLWL